jgi:pentatricopeptide repeat protein
MYAKCGSIEDARRVFNGMSLQDVVSWSSMIMGYVKCGEGQKALDLFQQMQSKGVRAARLCHLFGSAKCMCKHVWTPRR